MVVGESGGARNFAKTLDGVREVLHNLASLLQTKRKRRRGEVRSSLKIWTTDRCGCLDAKATQVAKSIKGNHTDGEIHRGRSKILPSVNCELFFCWIELKSLILAQIERWRHALHMQVERQHGSNPGGEWRTGE